MTHGKSDDEIIRTTHNTARFFTEHRQIAWVVLVGVILAGFYGYRAMPKRKDPDIPVRVAVALTRWPGATAEEVEQQVTRLVEQTIAQNPKIRPVTPDDYSIKSLSLPGLSIVNVQLAEDVTDTKRQWSDINLKLNALNGQLPQGAGPIQFNNDYGDTAALMLTVASPPADELEVALRARGVRRAIQEARAARPRGSQTSRISVVVCFPHTVPAEVARPVFEMIARSAARDGILRDARLFSGPGFLGLDGTSDVNDQRLLAYGRQFVQNRLHQSEIHPDAWPPVVIRDPQETQAKLAAVAGAKYSYRELDDLTDLIARTLHGVPQVSKVDRAGVLLEQVYLNYSQERLASYGLEPSELRGLLQARNITRPGGVLEVGQRNLLIDPSGEFQSEKDIGDVVVAASSTGAPVYLRDLVQISRGYQSPPTYLNFYSWRDAAGRWQRSRAVTLAVQMRAGEQIAEFARTVDAKLAAVRQLLPPDLIIARTSDQPLQTKESLNLFMRSLYEAIVLVVLVSLIGFWEWRSAFLMALSIPITLAMSFAMAYVVGVDLQQVSVASLIIALGLLVDDPVVANDAIKNSLAAGRPSVVAAWLGPTKLAHAIMYATVTNIVAYLPFLLLTGSTGEFLWSLPIVMTCALVASRIVSMTFIPLLGYHLLRRGRGEQTSEHGRGSGGFAGRYRALARAAIEHRWKVLAGSLIVLAVGAYAGLHLKTQFFPEDVQYWSTVDVRLPNDAPLSVTEATAGLAEDVIRERVTRYEREHPGKDGRPREVLRSLTTFIGGGGPRFWFSVSPELMQLNYAQIIIELTDKEATPELAPLLQAALSGAVPGARVDVRQLQTSPVDYPVEIRISAEADVRAGQEIGEPRTLRGLARQVEDIFRAVPVASRIRNDWDEESLTVKLAIDPDRANLSGVTNLDVANSSTAAMSGVVMTTLREGNKQIPVVARLRMEERGQLSDVQNLYVYASQGSQKVPLMQISSIERAMETQRIRRREHFRTIAIQVYPATGSLASEALNAALPQLRTFERTLPPGYTMMIGGEYAKQQRGFSNLVVVLAVSVFAIFLALVLQFNHAIKPFLVFAAVPYGVVGSLVALWVMGAPFGFMAFLGVVSLIGVIVSHVIVLFDFIEEMHAKGEPLEQALVDAGIARLRPVLITVGATVLALFPLALHGGPLWQPLCYAQIGGLMIATFITLLLVPVLYAMFVLDLKLVKWEAGSNAAP